MTVSELIEMLEDYDPDMQVKSALQPSWPLAAPIVGVQDTNDDATVWIVTGAASEYAPEGLY